MKKPFCVEFDDLCDASARRLDLLKDLKEKHPGFQVTLFTIPCRTSAGTIARAKSLGNWVKLAPHGWRHTRGECLAWTDEEARKKIQLARDMGIDYPCFRAPAWLLDGDVYKACDDLRISVASHKMFRLKHTGVREYVYNMPRGKFRAVHGHLTNCADNFIDDMLRDGRLSFPENAVFTTPNEMAEVCEY